MSSRPEQSAKFRAASGDISPHQKRSSRVSYGLVDSRLALCLRSVRSNDARSYVMQGWRKP